MRFRLVPKSSTLDDLEGLNCCTFGFSRNFASIQRWVLYYDSPGGSTMPTLSRLFLVPLASSFYFVLSQADFSF